MDWKNRLDQIKNKVKTQLNAKGVDCLVQLQQVFEEYDKDKSGTLDKLEFQEFMTKIGVFLSTQELTTVYNHFDKNRDGQIQYDEFISTLKTDMNEKRLAVVKHAWTTLDKAVSKRLQFDVLAKEYRAQVHPRVRTREKKVDTVYNDFISCLGAKAKGGVVTENDFIDYYADINACLPAEKDDYFVDLVLKTWGLTSEKEYVTSQRIAELEDIIFEKVRQRTHGADDEGKTVRKIFRHFDLDGFGTIEPNEFKKSLETLGCIFKEHEIDALFRKYDTNENGKLDYEEFAGFFARKGSGNNPNVNPVFGLTREAPNQVLDKIKATLKARGSHGIRGLGIVFRRIDNSKDRKLDRHEFMWGLKENGHALSPSEFERIFKYFDKNNDGKIDYDEFLRGIRGDLNQRRKQLVAQAFKKLDNTGDGLITFEDLEKAYNVEFHPQFKSGEKSKKEILTDFLKQWDLREADSKVTLEEFEDYYKDVSASIDNDDYFELIMKTAWHLV